MSRILIAGLVLTLAPAVALAGSASDQRSGSEKKQQAEKKGALRERVEPALDLKAQRANVKALRHDAAVEKANGNRVGAWAAEGDAKHAEKLMAKDQKLIDAGTQKQKVDDQAVKK